MEFHLTPLQTLAFYNAVANDGKLVKPFFVKELRSGNKIVKSFEYRSSKRKNSFTSNIG